MTNPCYYQLRQDLKANVNRLALFAFLLFLFLGGYLTSILITRWSYDTHQHAYQSHWSERSTCNITYTYLPAIDHYYKNSTTPVTIQSPTNYEVLPDGQLWHYGAMASNDTPAKVAVFVPPSVTYLQVFLKSHLTDINTTYNFNLSTSHRNNSWDELISVHGEDVNEDARIRHLFSNAVHSVGKHFVVVFDLSDYVTRWVNGNWNLSMKTENNSITNSLGEITFPQPVLCVQYQRSTGEEQKLQGVLRNYLMKRIMTESANKKREIESFTKNGRAKRSLAERRERSIGNRECQMYKLEVKLEDLGLLQVIHPTKIDLKYCLGTCQMLDDPALFNTNALLRVKYKFLYGGSVPSPQCTPTQFSYLHFFVKHGDQMRKVVLYDLDVAACGCR